MYIKTKYFFKTFLSEEKIFSKLQGCIDEPFTWFPRAIKPFYGYLAQNSFKVSPTSWFFKRTFLMTCEGKFYKNNYPAWSIVELGFSGFITRTVIFLFLLIVIAIFLFVKAGAAREVMYNLLLFLSVISLTVCLLAAARIFRIVRKLKTELELFE